jgi:hypothetical protein
VERKSQSKPVLQSRGQGTERRSDYLSFRGTLAATRNMAQNLLLPDVEFSFPPALAFSHGHTYLCFISGHNPRAWEALLMIF